MKLIGVFVFLVFLSACTIKKNDKQENQNIEIDRSIIIPEFQSFIDSANVEGSILVYDLKADKYFSNNFDWAPKGNLPASTFKITNSIIALESGVIENDSVIFKWNGAQRNLKIWEQDLVFSKAFHYSCVPCYQDIARKIGVKRMNHFLHKLDYKTMIVDSTNIDVFWLQGASRINQFQQIKFLKRLYNSELPIAQRTEAIMKKLMVIKADDHYTLSGKTGWSIRNGNNNGWFVGYVETKFNTFFFATNIEPNESFKMNKFPSIRKEVTYKALEHLGIM